VNQDRIDTHRQIAPLYYPRRPVATFQPFDGGRVGRMLQLLARAARRGAHHGIANRLPLDRAAAYDATHVDLGCADHLPHAIVNGDDFIGPQLHAVTTPPVPDDPDDLPFGITLYLDTHQDDVMLDNVLDDELAEYDAYCDDWDACHAPDWHCGAGCTDPDQCTHLDAR